MRHINTDAWARLSDSTCFYVFNWVGNRNTPSFFWMFKLMVTALFRNQNSTLCLKLLDQFFGYYVPSNTPEYIHIIIHKNLGLDSHTLRR